MPRLCVNSQLCISRKYMRSDDVVLGTGRDELAKFTVMGTDHEARGREAAWQLQHTLYHKFF
jgi:hypothetical protein